MSGAPTFPQVMSIMDATNDPQHPNFREACAKYEDLMRFGDSPMILAQLMCSPPSNQNILPKYRQLAGLWLKRSIKVAWKNPKVIQQQSLQGVQQALIDGIGIPDENIRSSVSIAITDLLAKCGLLSWTNLVPTLIKMLNQPFNQNSNLEIFRGALTTLSYICKDHSERLTILNINPHPLDLILPCLINWMGCPSLEFSYLALDAFCPFLLTSDRPSQLKIHIVTFIPAFWNFMIKNEQTSKANIPKEVSILELDTISTLVDNWSPYINQHITYCLTRMYKELDSPIDQCKLIATDFWYTVPDTHRDLIRNNIDSAKLEQLLVKLVDLTVMGPRDMEAFGILPDGSIVQPEDPDSYAQRRYYGSVRVNASWAILTLTTAFREQVLTPIFKILSKKTGAENHWTQRECALLTFGNIIYPIYQSLRSYMPAIYSFVYDIAVAPDDQIHPALRYISLWVLGRLSSWLFEELANYTNRTPDNNNPAFVKAKTAALTRIQNVKTLYFRNMEHFYHQVRTATCSALSEFIEAADGPGLNASFSEIFGKILAVQTKYPKNIRSFLYDVVHSLWSMCSQQAGQQKNVDLLMNAFKFDWDNLPDTDIQITTLFSMLYSVSLASGKSMAKYAPLFLDRAHRIINSYTEAEGIALLNEEEPPDRRFLSSSYRLIESLVDALGPDINQNNLFSSHLPDLFDRMLLHCRFYDETTSRCVLGLWGDLFLHLPNLISDELAKELFIIAFDSMVPYMPKVCINSLWMAQSISKAKPYLTAPALRYIHKAVSSERPRSSLQNFLTLFYLEDTVYEGKKIQMSAASTAGYFAHADPNTITQQLTLILPVFCEKMSRMSDSPEKYFAIGGIFKCIDTQPTAGRSNFLGLLQLLGTIKEKPPPILVTLIQQVMGKIRPNRGHFIALFSGLPHQKKSNLAQNLGISP